MNIFQLEACPPGGVSSWRRVLLEACPPGGLSAGEMTANLGLSGAGSLESVLWLQISCKVDEE